MMCNGTVAMKDSPKANDQSDQSVAKPSIMTVILTINAMARKILRARKIHRV